MKDMIKKIVDMDKKAQELDEQNKIEKQNFEKEIADEKQKIYDRYIEEAKSESAQNEAELKKEAEAVWLKNEEKRKTLIENLQNDYEANCDKWVDTIVKRVIAQ